MVSILTALIIQENKTNVNSYQDKNSQKWGYKVSCIERGNYRPLVTCSPVYDSEKIAKKEGNGFVKLIRKLDLSPKRKELGNLLGDSKEIVQSVVNAVKNPL
jgi:hypothetical protein